MHPTITGQLTAQRITEWHQQAASDRLVRQVRAANAVRPASSRARARRVRLSWRRSRPAFA